MTVTGKVQKFRMREITVAELALARVNDVESDLRVALRGDRVMTRVSWIILAAILFGRHPAYAQQSVREPGEPELP
jgi:hypothetical protein